MPYVDGFLLPVPTKNLKAYVTMSKKARQVWMDHGALEYIETIGDDFSMKGMVPFPDAAKAKKGESVVFSWIVYKSKAHRNAVNKKVMADPRIQKMMPSNGKMPFDCARMSMGGFKVIVEARA